MFYSCFVFGNYAISTNVRLWNLCRLSVKELSTVILACMYVRCTSNAPLRCLHTITSVRSNRSANAKQRFYVFFEPLKNITVVLLTSVSFIPLHMQKMIIHLICLVKFVPFLCFFGCIASMLDGDVANSDDIIVFGGDINSFVIDPGWIFVVLFTFEIIYLIQSIERLILSFFNAASTIIWYVVHAAKRVLVSS